MMRHEHYRLLPGFYDHRLTIELYTIEIATDVERPSSALFAPRQSERRRRLSRRSKIARPLRA